MTTLRPEAKFEADRAQTLYGFLPPEDQSFVRTQALELRFTRQELKTFCQAARDLDMWDETPLAIWWPRERAALGESPGLAPRDLKKHLFGRLETFLETLRRAPKNYPEDAPGAPQPPAPRLILRPGPEEAAVAGLCPVASDKTLCCRLRTIDAVTRCAYGCSYCTIQSFYDKDDPGAAVLDTTFAQKLRRLRLDPFQRYHFGSGQASDSLLWGNAHGVLDALMEFASRRTNVLLELKTKSANVADLLSRPVPRNVVCSWSINTPAVIRNEEHGTAPLEARLEAARRTAESGVFVGFHFHPMVFYAGWEEDYERLAARVMELFTPEQVLFVSLGTLTFIRPVLRRIRERGQKTKILQMPLVPDPHGKLTYPDETKIGLYRALLSAFAPWRDRVFFYLCMEKKKIWDAVFSHSYADSAAFERDFLDQTFSRLWPL